MLISNKIKATQSFNKLSPSKIILIFLGAPISYSKELTAIGSVDPKIQEIMKYYWKVISSKMLSLKETPARIREYKKTPKKDNKIIILIFLLNKNRSLLYPYSKTKIGIKK